MIEIPFLFLEFVFTLIWLAIRAGVWYKQKHIDWKREAVLLLMYINLAVIIVILAIIAPLECFKFQKNSSVLAKVSQSRNYAKKFGKQKKNTENP